MAIKATKLDPKIVFAAQNAQLGHINVQDLSLLTGVDAPLLTSFAKKGFMKCYGEYQGKRFFDFVEIVNWLHDDKPTDETKTIIRVAMKELLEDDDCPYYLERSVKDGRRVKIVWKEAA